MYIKYVRCEFLKKSIFDGNMGWMLCEIHAYYDF